MNEEEISEQLPRSVNGRNSPFYNRMRTNLYMLRCAKFLAQKDCDEVIGLKKSRYEQLETRIGVPSVEEIVKICNFYSVTFEELMFKEAKLVFI